MQDKLTISLTWHNCQTCPPQEPYTYNLVVTDGTNVFRAKYDNLTGWTNLDIIKKIPFDMLYDYWWADLEQTVRERNEFKGE